MINTLKINSNKILFLTLNRAQSQEIKNKIEYIKTSSLNIGSYFSFIQKELKIYWPLVLKECQKIKVKRINPIFMTFEASQNLMLKLVEYYREKGFLTNLNMPSEEISKKILSNLSILAFSNENYMHYSKLMKLNEFKILEENIYEELNQIINIYVEKTLEKGAIDYALGVYLYNNYLLKNTKYLNSLKERFSYVLIDKAELMNPCQVDFVNLLESSLEELCIFFNSNGAYGIYAQNEEYIREKILPNYLEIYIEKEENPILDLLGKNLLYNKEYPIDFENLHKKMDFDINKEVGRSLINDLDYILEKQGNLDSVFLISPSRDVSLEYLIESYAKKRKIPFSILNRNEKIIDNVYINALSIFALLYYSFDEIKINYDELKIFLKIFLGINIIKASMISDYIINKNSTYNKLIDIKNPKLIEALGEQLINKYENLRMFLQELKKENLNIDVLLKTVYLKFYLKKEFNENLLKECKSLIESASNFISVMSLFDGIKNLNLEFLNFIREGSKENESIYQIEERNDFKGLSLASPISFLNYNKKSRIIFLLDIKNNLWQMNNVNTIQNPYILTKTGKNKKIYTLEIHEEFQILALNNTIKLILSSNKEDIYVYAHKYNSSSFEKNSILAQNFSY